MTRDQAHDMLHRSIQRLTRDDAVLLKNNVSERAVTHRLGIYLEEDLNRRGILRFPNMPPIHVDCEYNRNAQEGVGEPKRLQIIEKNVKEILEAGALSEEVRRSVTTFPDIIVHHRGFNDYNLLLIEVKMSTNNTSLRLDLDKLQAFTEPTGPNRYCYQHGVFVVLGAADQWQLEPRLRWFRNGEEVD